MAKRIYLMPLAVVGTLRGPKYIRCRATPRGLDVAYSGVPYGKRNVMLVSVNVTRIQHVLLKKNTDVFAVPVNLNNMVTVNGTLKMRAALSYFKIPADWLSTSITYRGVLKRIVNLFFLAQQCHSKWDLDIFDDDTRPESKLQNLPVNKKQRLIELARTLSVDLSLSPTNIDVRTALRLMSDALPENIISFDGEAL